MVGLFFPEVSGNDSGLFRLKSQNIIPDKRKAIKDVEQAGYQWDGIDAIKKKWKFWL